MSGMGRFLRSISELVRPYLRKEQHKVTLLNLAKIESLFFAGLVSLPNGKQKKISTNWRPYFARGISGTPHFLEFCN